MKHCCFMFFELAPGVRGLGVFFFFVNLVLLLPVADDWMELLTPPAVPGVPPSDTAVPAAGPLLLRVYRRHRRPLLAVSAAAVALGLLVNVLLAAAAAPSRRPGRRRLLLLPWLAWHAALFSAATLAVLLGLMQWVRGRLVLSVPAALIGLGLLPLCWYWFAAVLSLFRNFPTSPPPSAKKRKKTPAAGRPACGRALAAGLAGGGGGRAGSPGDLGSLGSVLGSAGGDARTEGAAEVAVNGTGTELPLAGNGGLLQTTLGHAVWYWAAINAAVMDEQERCRQQELLREQEQREEEEGRRSRGRSLVSLESLRSAWRRLTLGSESADDPAEPALPGPDQRRSSSAAAAAGRRLLLCRQHACVEDV